MENTVEVTLSKGVAHVCSFVSAGAYNSYRKCLFNNIDVENVDARLPLLNVDESIEALTIAMLKKLEYDGKEFELSRESLMELPVLEFNKIMKKCKSIFDAERSAEDDKKKS